MKKVIDGHLYNSNTATMLGKWDNGQRGFEWCSETLYRNRAGLYFLHGDGKARSRYSKWENGCLYGDERIIPLALDEAKKWAEEHLDGDEYISAFGDPEDTSRVVTSISLTPAAKSKLESLADGRSASAVIESLIMQA